MGGRGQGGVRGGGYAQVATRFVHMLRSRPMGFFGTILGCQRLARRAAEDAETALAAVHRLEITARRLQERLDDLEGRHASLSAQYRGRLGGRPTKPQEARQQGPLPLGATILPLHQE